MIIWVILGVAIIAVTLSYRMLNNNAKNNESFYIKGLVIEKKTGKMAEGVEVTLGQIEVNKSDNNFLPFEGMKMKTKNDGKFEFEIEKKGVFWVMAIRNDKKVLKPLNTEKGSIEDILLTV